MIKSDKEECELNVKRVMGTTTNKQKIKRK